MAEQEKCQEEQQNKESCCEPKKKEKSTLRKCGEGVVKVGTIAVLAILGYKEYKNGGKNIKATGKWLGNLFGRKGEPVVKPEVTLEETDIVFSEPQSQPQHRYEENRRPQWNNNPQNRFNNNKH